MRKIIFLFFIVNVLVSCHQQEIKKPNYNILNEKERAIVRDEIIEDRFNNLLPKLMDKTDIDVGCNLKRIQRRSSNKNHVAVCLVKCKKKNHLSFLSK